MNTPFTYTDKKLARKARRFCRKAHRGQKDNQSKPYYKHPFAVAASFTDGSMCQIIAYLHDVVEDTDYTFLDIQDRFGIFVGEMVAVLSRPEWLDYQTYINAIKKQPTARLVKIADIRHNLAIDRALLNLAHQRRYAKALYELTKED